MELNDFWWGRNDWGRNDWIPRGRVRFLKENNIRVLLMQPSKQLPLFGTLVQPSDIQRQNSMLHVVKLVYSRSVLPFQFADLNS